MLWDEAVLQMLCYIVAEITTRKCVTCGVRIASLRFPGVVNPWLERDWNVGCVE
jgi:hypothetical protein